WRPPWALRFARWFTWSICPVSWASAARISRISAVTRISSSVVDISGLLHGVQEVGERLRVQVAGRPDHQRQLDLAPAPVAVDRFGEGPHAVVGVVVDALGRVAVVIQLLQGVRPQPRQAIYRFLGRVAPG